MNSLHTVYDFGKELPSGDAIIIWLFFPALLAAGFYGRYLNNRGKLDKSGSKLILNEIKSSDYNEGASVFFLGLIGIMFILFTATLVTEYYIAWKTYSKKLYLIVEGRIENYHPMPRGLHDSERFDVHGVHFKLPSS